MIPDFIPDEFSERGTLGVSLNMKRNRKSARRYKAQAAVGGPGSCTQPGAANLHKFSQLI